MTEVELQSGGRMKSGDTDPDLEVKLLDDGVPRDLSGSPEVSVYIKVAGRDELVVDDDTSGNVSITDAPNGTIEYSWQSADLETAATYVGEVEVVDGGETTTYPNFTNFKIHVEEGLN